MADEISKVIGKRFPCQQRGLGLTWKLRFDDLIVVGGKTSPRELKWFQIAEMATPRHKGNSIKFFVNQMVESTCVRAPPCWRI